MSAARHRRRQDRHRPKHGARFKPQTDQVGRCQTCGHLFDRVKGDDGRECLSCREQPPLFRMGEAII